MDFMDEESLISRMINDGFDHREIMVTIAPPSLDLDGVITYYSIEVSEGVTRRYLRVVNLEDRKAQGKVWLAHGFMPSGVSRLVWDRCKSLLLVSMAFLGLFIAGCTRTVETNVNTDVLPHDPNVINKINLGASVRGTW